MSNIVQYISFRNEKYPVRISYYAIKKFQQETKKDITEIDKDISLLETLLWFGLVAGHSAEKKELILKKDDMELILDESMEEFNDIIMSFFPLVSDSESSSKKK